MKIRYPKYYEKFSCIAGQCEDTCCAGWEIDIDDKSYEYYKNLPGEFGERIRNNIKEYSFQEEDVYESHGFLLKENKRCPFLNDQNLCDIIIALGEDAICDVCTDTPRNYLEYGGTREISLSPSCAEAGRLLFGSDEKIVIVEKEVDEEYGLEETQSEMVWAKAIKRARDFAIGILQNREKTIEERIFLFLLYAEKVQSEIIENTKEEPLEARVEKAFWNIQQNTSYLGKNGKTDSKEVFSLFQARMESFGGMESINEEWQSMIDGMKETFLQDNGENYIKWSLAWETYRNQNQMEYQYEQLMVYNAFLLLSRCVDDDNFWSKAQLCVAGFFMIRDMDIYRFYENKGVYTLEDRVDVVRIYAKEVEHSQENLEYLEEEFLFEDLYRIEELEKQLWGGTAIS